MKVREMVAYCLLTGAAAVAIPQWSLAQDSGPGPVPPATVAVYDATIRHFSNLTATFTFSAGEGSQGIFTTGAFEADINGTLVTGTWQAVDLGSFSVWTARASGETSTFIAAGLATPSAIVGQAITNVAGGGNLRYVITGQVGVSEPPAT